MKLELVLVVSSLWSNPHPLWHPFNKVYNKEVLFTDRKRILLFWVFFTLGSNSCLYSQSHSILNSKSVCSIQNLSSKSAKMSPLYFPLRWESTGEQWWYASPIDCAAASGHYELVKELLCIDTNLLIKLTSLRRIRRLETVWDDDDKFNDVAKCRAYVAKKLVLECETKCGSNSLIRAGYGGWLLYTAASAGDVSFVQDLLERDPLLVFGEGEYGITDILYASARSNNYEVFMLLFNSAVNMRRSFNGDVEEGDEFMLEMMNRAVHCAVRGGNLEVLKHLLVDCYDVLVYTDALGSTILHSAAARGQVEVMKHLIALYEIVESTDDQGNTALHIAAYNGFLAAVEALLAASSSLAELSNKQGYTFLHMAVAGFQVPGFHRIDQHLELMKQLVSSSTNIVYIQDLINARNNQGRTALHLAVSENIQANLVELLMTIPCIDLNITDVNGMTALDLLKQHPESASSKLLVKQMIAAGATVSCRKDRKSASVEPKLNFSIGSVPGTSFKVADSEIFLYVQTEDNSNTTSSCSSHGYSGELSETMNSSGGSKNSASTVLKQLLQLPKKKDKKFLQDSLSSNETPTPLRQRFSGGCSLPNNKRVIPIRCEIPSSSAKKFFTANLMQGVVIQQPMPKSVISLANSPSTPFSRSFRNDKSPTKEKLMNHYFCFGAQGLAVENLISYETPQHFQNKCVVNL